MLGTSNSMLGTSNSMLGTAKSKLLTSNLTLMLPTSTIHRIEIVRTIRAQLAKNYENLAAWPTKQSQPNSVVSQTPWSAKLRGQPGRASQAAWSAKQPG